MKKVSKIFAVLSLVMVMAAGSASAQKIHYGVKAGLNLNNILMDESDDIYSSPEFSNPIKLGFNLGIFGEYMFTNNMGVAAEILYSQQGRKEKYDSDNNDDYYVSEITSNNVIVPVLFRFYPTSSFSLEIGPQFGFIMGGTTKYTTKVGGSENTQEVKWSETEEDLQKIDSDYEGWKRFDLGVAFGANYNFDFGMFVGLRCNVGLTDFMNEAKLGLNSVDAENVKSKNFVISVNVGYRF